MTKTTPSDFRPQTSYFILVKDFVQDSSLDFEHLRCDPHKNPSQKRGIRAHFQLRFSLKIIISCRRQHLKQDFLQRFLAVGN